MNRRTFLRSVGAAGIALAARGAGAAEQPNVVMIISDDQAWGDYGFMGHPHIQTPRLDRLAAESLLYTRGYVPAPLCSPSLASMVTGLYPHQHKNTSNDPVEVKGERLATRPDYLKNLEGVPNLPSLLGDAGYVSMQTGKWWLGSYQDGHFTHGMTHGDPAHGGRHGDKGLDIGRKGLEPIKSFLDETKGKPFFLWYAPIMPHAPHTPPERILEKYTDKTPSPPVAKYWAMCEWFDETCGELLDILDERGLAKNTLVLYVCDNGWIQDPDQANKYAPRSKRTHYEGGIRTPIMARWPGKIAPLRDDTTQVSSVDLAPTALAACGVKQPAAMQGIDLKERAKLAARGGVCGGQYVHTALDNHDPLANLEYLWTVRGDWKLSVPAGLTPPSDSTVELYNLRSDPDEQHNLAAEKPEQVRALFGAIQAWWPEGAATAKV